MTVRNIVGAPENESVMDVRQLLLPGDLENMSEIMSDREELEIMNRELTDAIDYLDESTENIDREISSFRLLDRFLYDPLGIEHLEDYITELHELIDTSDLNAVTSSIALSTLGTLEMYKQIRDTIPGFDPALITQYLDEAQQAKAMAMTELMVVESEVSFGTDTLNYARKTLEKKITFKERLKSYNDQVVARAPHLFRHHNIVNSTGLIDIFSSKPEISVINTQIFESDVNSKAAENMVEFTLECARTM